MDAAAIFHQADSDYAYLYQPNDFRVRLRTKRDDVQAVQCFYGDPYDSDQGNWQYQVIEMKKIARTEVHDYWGASLSVAHNRLQYDFVVTGMDGTTVLYGDRGVFPFSQAAIGRGGNPFRQPYLHEVDRVKEPDWVRQTVWYQIFPDRFNNGDQNNDPKATKPWNSEDHPERTDYYGGDLQGVLDKLDYLQDLGVNGLYFCPIFTAYSNHKYDTIDYLTIDPDFGDKAVFHKLVEEAHARGMKIMLDAVFNHIGDRSVPWQDVLEHGEKSRFASWFHIHKFPITFSKTTDFEKAEDLSFDTFAYTPHMPKLNTANSQAKRFLLSVARYWIKEYDIDAWRLDVAHEVDHHFWRDFATVCHEAKPDFYILGEVWHSAQPWLRGDEFSAVMNYAYTETIIDGFVHQNLRPSRMVAGLDYQRMHYRKQVNEVMLNTLDSHDTARLLTVCAGNKQLLRQTVAFTYLQEGEPCIYYGSEVGMTGSDDPDCRKPMNWNPKTQDHELFAFYQKLIQLRLTYAQTLTKGDLDWSLVDDERGLVQITRQDHDHLLIGTFNLSGQSQDLADLSLPGDQLLAQGVKTGKIARHGYLVTCQKTSSK